jgi:hypothetical protein
LSVFKDKRLDARYEALQQSMQDKQSVIVRQLAQNRNEEVAYGRFLNNQGVTPRQMIRRACETTAQISKGRDVLLIEDTSTMSFGLFSSDKGLSSVGDGTIAGFFLHPVISVDAQTNQCLGLASAKIYERQTYKEDVAQRKRDRNREKLSQKESNRWYKEIEHVVEIDQGANSYTVVADREADIYELLVLLTTLGVGFVIRSFQNRRLYGRNGLKLEDVLASTLVQGSYYVNVPRTDKRSAHQADMEVKWVNVELTRPRSGTGTKHLVEKQKVWVVEVREKASSVVGKERPIYWRLYTSHPINSLEDALKIIDYYVQRWIIEQVFRTLKKKGLNFGTAQVENTHALKNLCALCRQQAGAVVLNSGFTFQAKNKYLFNR